jgi:hypothetical protein
MILGFSLLDLGADGSVFGGCFDDFGLIGDGVGFGIGIGDVVGLGAEEYLPNFCLVEVEDIGNPSFGIFEFSVVGVNRLRTVWLTEEVLIGQKLVLLGLAVEPMLVVVIILVFINILH